jgi:murein L,D-transpeptidase YcbB/YkuD
MSRRINRMRFFATGIGQDGAAWLALSVAVLAGTGCGRREAARPQPAASGPAAVPAEPTGSPDPEVARTVEKVLGSAEHPALRWRSISDVTALLRKFYDKEDDRLLWFAGSAPLPALEEALACVRGAAEHGLDPADYDAGWLSQSWAALKAGRASASDRALFDLGLSVAAARMITAVHLGRVDPAAHDWGYDLARKRLDLEARLLRARRGGGLAAALEALQPPFAHYARARRTLAAYRALAAAGEPLPVPEFPKGRSKVAPGKEWEGVPALAARLRTFGDLPAGAAAAASARRPPVYEGALVEAMKSFQERHGLDPDGVIGRTTIAALNVSLAHRVRQIELAMERMRWLPELGERPNLFANVALFRMWATDPKSGDEPLRMKIIVGKSLKHETPMFIERMEYVVFRPYWNPPPSIVRAEIVPAARDDPSYLEKHDMEIVASGAEDAVPLPATPESLEALLAGRLYVRQKPGPDNALGLAKFIFPNHQSIYMHGTPAPALFARARRDFSHGCIRVEDPLALAAWVLRDNPGWTRERIETAMNADRPTQVNLKEPLDVVLFYDTVHVNSEGVVFFVDDIYGDDAKLDAALREGYPYPLAPAAPATRSGATPSPRSGTP